jgi:acyl-CoA synthetase (NDP forming)
MIDDPETRVIAGYVEGFQDAHRLLGIGRRALSAGKPVLVWKVGTSEAGARAAASHTANLGGSMALYRAAFRQSGIIEVKDVGDLADCAKALLPGRLPKGDRMAIVTISGGAGIAMADGAAEGGLQLPTLAPATVNALKEVLPSFAAIANPLDVTASLLNDANLLRVTLEQLANDPNVDMIGLALAAASGKLATELANEIVRDQRSVRDTGAGRLERRPGFGSRRLRDSRCGPHSALSIAGALRKGRQCPVVVCPGAQAIGGGAG